MARAIGKRPEVLFARGTRGLPEESDRLTPRNTLAQQIPNLQPERADAAGTLRPARAAVEDHRQCAIESSSEA